MPRSMRWRNLLPGLVGVAVLAAMILGVLLFARVGALHGRTFVLFTATAEARGVIPGTEVWLSGQKVGLVDAIRFRQPASDTTRRVLLELEILERYRRHIRRDSKTQIRSGGTLIGAQVVHISPGTGAAPSVEQGDTLPSLPQGDAEEIASQVAAAGRQLPELLQNVRRIQQLASADQGTDGVAGREEAVIRLDVLQQNVTRLRRGIADGEGTLALAARDRELVARARRAAARADTIRTLIASEHTSLGRFRRDTTLVREIDSVRNELSIVGSLLRGAHGSAGRALHDGAIPRELAGIERELAALADDIRQHPLRYLAF